jgi:hypothetical protein
VSRDTARHRQYPAGRVRGWTQDGDQQVFYYEGKMNKKDDVCVWTKSDIHRFFDTKCMCDYDDECKQVKVFNYCPYCGKKIKVNYDTP